jgi:hypothetical protein
MDLKKTIQDFYAEKEKLERVIASLEELQRAAEANPALPGRNKRRGRKSMGAQERLEVSERMKKYWAGRRRASRKNPSDSATRSANGS